MFALILIRVASPQTPDTVVVPAGSEYRSGSFHRTMYGDLWRDLWTTPIKFPVLNLTQMDGGLVPINKEDSSETRTLLFKGSGGRIWKFRSLNKFTTVTLPADVQNSYVGNFFQEMTAAAFPAATPLLTPMMDSLGIIHSNPFLCFLLDSPILGEYREEFRNLPGTIEPFFDTELITTSQNEKALLLSTGGLIKRLLTAKNEKVDGASFLKARLFDVFVNDWNRNQEQWDWIKPVDSSVVLWTPVPKNRDKAFSRFDGVYPKLSTFMISQWTSFESHFPPPDLATVTGKFLDKRFLSELSRSDWDSVTNFVVSKLTDELFDTALDQIPSFSMSKSFRDLKPKLIERREKLKAFSDEYYNLINKVVDVFATDLNDELDIVRKENSTLITLTTSGGTTYKKEFDNGITEDIRIHLLGGDDKVKMAGRVESGPLIRVDGGAGKEYFIDSSRVDGWFLNFLPIRRAENKNIFFDDDPTTIMVEGSGTVFRVEKPFEQNEAFDFFEPVVRQHGRSLSFNPVFDLSSTLGLQFGGGPVLTNYDFRKKPWDSWISFVVSYATKPKDYDAEFEGYFNSVLDGATVGFKALRKSIDFYKYYGYGNETVYEQDRFSRGEFDIFRILTGIETSIDFDIYDGLHNFYLVKLSRYDTEVTDQNILSGFPSGTYGLGKLTFLTVGTGFLIDKRDHADLPLVGYYFRATGFYTPKLFNLKGEIYSGNFDVRGYIPLPFIKNSALALRVTGERITGDYPFYMSSFLGGSKNLRGFRNERFSGDASLYGCAELRIALFRLKTILTSNIGFYLFSEAGRVFRDGEISKLWHVSNGVGVYSHILDRKLVIASSIAFSQETVNLSLSTKVNF